MSEVHLKGSLNTLVRALSMAFQGRSACALGSGFLLGNCWFICHPAVLSMPEDESPFCCFWFSVRVRVAEVIWARGIWENLVMPLVLRTQEEIKS